MSLVSLTSWSGDSVCAAIGVWTFAIWPRLRQSQCRPNPSRQSTRRLDRRYSALCHQALGTSSQCNVLVRLLKSRTKVCAEGY
jgi:hypothetical protein